MKTICIPQPVDTGTTALPDNLTAITESLTKTFTKQQNVIKYKSYDTQKHLIL
jgi:hypothetical protein